MVKRVYILVRVNKDDSETILKTYIDEKMAKAEMENLEMIAGRKKGFNYFITQSVLVVG